MLEAEASQVILIVHIPLSSYPTQQCGAIWFRPSCIGQEHRANRSDAGASCDHQQAACRILTQIEIACRTGEVRRITFAQAEEIGGSRSLWNEVEQQGNLVRSIRSGSD